MSNYAVQLLKNERDILKHILDTWSIKGYEEAKKDRMNKLKQLEDAIKILRDE